MVAGWIAGERLRAQAVAVAPALGVGVVEEAVVVAAGDHQRDPRRAQQRERAVDLTRAAAIGEIAVGHEQVGPQRLDLGHRRVAHAVGVVVA